MLKNVLEGKFIKVKNDTNPIQLKHCKMDSGITVQWKTVTIQ